MEYISVREAAKKWGISERRVRALCESGRIEGASRCGNWVWNIPANIQQPADGRALRYIKNRNLKTGVQDYAQIDKIRKSAGSPILTDYQKASVIREAFAYGDVEEKRQSIEILRATNQTGGKLTKFAYGDVELSRETVLEIFRLKNQNLPLRLQVVILNMKSVLSHLPIEISEKSICKLNAEILRSVDEKSGGLYKEKFKANELQAMITQYGGSWSVLHPVARAAFLFAEIIRIEPFAKANIQTAFVLLTSELIKAKLPPAIFGAEKIDELKAALASAKMRGNTQTLVEMIIRATTKNEKDSQII